MQIKENISSPTTNLNSLDNTTLSNLFSFFSPRDAALIGATCKRLQNIENKLFKRDYTKFDFCQEIKVIKENIRYGGARWIKYLPNGNLVVYTDVDNCFYLLDHQFKVIKKVIAGGLQSIEVCGDFIVVGAQWHGHVSVWDGVTGEIVYEEGNLPCKFLWERSPITCILSLTNNLFIVILNDCGDPYLYLFDIQAKNCKLLLKDEIDAWSKLELISSDSFVGVEKSGSVSIFKLYPDQSIQKTKLFQLPKDVVRFISILKLNNELLLICDAEENINVISLSKRKFLYKFSSGQHCTSSIIKLSNTHFATVCEKGIFRMWDVNKKNCIYPFPGNKFNMLKDVADVTKLGNGDFITCNRNGNLVKWMFEPLENVKKNKSTFQQMGCRIS